MTVTSIRSPSELGVRRRAPRLAGDVRRAQIVETAARFFADSGFSTPTRDLAASIGVTQALLYRYFDSKTGLIDAVFDEVFRNHWSEGALDCFLGTAGAPMVERLTATYELMLPRMTRTAVRLFFRAGLDSYPQPIHQSAAKSWPIWIAMLEEWRRDEGLPPLVLAPMFEGERALMLAVHNAMAMIRTREHVLQMPRMLNDADEICQVAETQDAGVRAALRRLHAGEACGRRTTLAGETQEAA